MHFVLPTDERASRSDLANDCVSPAAAEKLVDTPVPPQPDDCNPFSSDAVRDMIRDVISSLNVTHPGAWDLADVVRILERRNLKDKSREQTF